MIKRILVLICIISSIHLKAQNGIGTTTPDPSAKLDVTSSNKGFLPPRVTLTGYMDNSTIPSPATGLLVYNTGTNANLAAGYYYWNGSAWATIATAGGSGSFAASFMRGSRSAAQTTGLTNGGTIIFTQTDNSSGNDISLNTSTGQITLAAGKTYRLIAQVPNYQNSSADSRPQFAWYNETNSSYIGSSSASYSPSSAAGWGTTGGLSEVIITTTTTTIVSFRILQISYVNQIGGNGDFTTTGSYPWFEAQVISGNAPVTGQSVDYAMASISSTQTISSVSNFIFNTISGAGITLNNGGFNLIANKTYKLEASLGGSSTGYIYYIWVDNSNNPISGSSVGTVMQAGVGHSDAPQDKAVAFYTPTSNTTVYLRIYNTNGSFTGYPPSTSTNYSSAWATIQQVGSSAIVNPWVLSGNDVYNTTGKVGIGTNSPTTKLDVTGDVNVTGALNVTASSANANIAANALLIGNSTGDEGGEMRLALAQTNQSLSTSVNMDIYRNNLRIFEGGGNNRGVSIDLSKAPNSVGGELMWKASGFVSRGVDVTLGNLKVRFASAAAGNMSLQISTVSGTYSVYGSGLYSYGGAAGTTIDGGSPRSVTTTPVYLNSGYNFGTAGATDMWVIMDTSLAITWRITGVIGAGYNNNFISIERLN